MTLKCSESKYYKTALKAQEQALVLARKIDKKESKTM